MKHICCDWPHIFVSCGPCRKTVHLQLIRLSRNFAISSEFSFFAVVPTGCSRHSPTLIGIQIQSTNRRCCEQPFIVLTKMQFVFCYTIFVLIKVLSFFIMSIVCQHFSEEMQQDFHEIYEDEALCPPSECDVSSLCYLLFQLFPLLQAICSIL